MDIKKIVRKILLEQPDGEAAPNQQPQLTRQQKELYDRLAAKWKQEVPELSDDEAMKIYLAYRKAIQSVKDETQPQVNSFLIRGNGKYNINDLRTPNNVSLSDLLDFLLDLSKFRIKIGNNGDTDAAKKMEKERLDKIFSERVEGKREGAITPKKIEESKKMWEGQQNLVINEGDFRVYSINTQEEAIRYGYYYQEKLRELLTHNVDNNVPAFKDMYRDPRDTYEQLRHSATPWCVFSRGDDQAVRYKDRLLVNPISNQYKTYRSSQGLFFYVVIDESKDLFGRGGEYYISTIMAKDSGGFKIANMYNGEYNISENDLLKIYPKLNGQFDKLTFKKYDSKIETGTNVEVNILDTINEIEGSPSAFWMQTADIKEAYINAGGTLKNPKSWSVLNNDLRKQYIDSIANHDATVKVSNEEFLKAIIKSGVHLKERLDKKLRDVGFRGIGYLVDDFMKVNYRTDFYGKKNESIRIYKNIRTNLHGIFNVDEGDWVKKDGVEYEANFKKTILPHHEGVLFDDANNMEYIVTEFASPSNKFYILIDFNAQGNERFYGYIMSDRKYGELKEKLDDNQGVDTENDVDIAEDYI